MNSEEIENLKVADLKRELKNRGLPVSGNKGELVQRLMEYLSSEERKILQTNGSEIDDTEDVLDLPEEDVLGISMSDDLSPPKTVVALKKPTVSTNPTATTTTTTAAAAAAPKKLSTEKLPSSPVRPATEAKPVPSEATSSETVAEQKPKHTKITFGSDNMPTETQKKLERAKRFHTPLTDDTRKELRTEKFSSQGKTQTMIKPLINVKTTSSPESQEILKRRAERFGLGNNQNSTTAVVSKSPPSVDSAKLAKRAERFGLQKTTADPVVKANATTDTTDPTDTTDSGKVDKISLRKKRFGDLISDQTSAKKLLRAEKFGLK